MSELAPLIPLEAAERYYVYLLSCANGSLYVGYTRDVEQRVAQHNAGRGGRYTRMNRPVSLIAVWSFNDGREARKAERMLKCLSPSRKLLMAASVHLWQESVHE